MKHIFEKGQNNQTLVLLHGTGGNEHDLLPLGKLIDPHANLLGIRGNVLEYGMPRFFKRLAMGVFDIESLKEETERLYDFIKSSSETYHFDMKHVTVIGYSNGANILGSMLLHYNQAFHKAILFHPMIPIKEIEMNNLKEVSIFIGAGKTDHMVLVDETLTLKEMFEQRGATVELFLTELGHQLSRDEIEHAKIWYEKSQR
ncbi:MAG: carboxylesterase [Tenericutes bacterium HGW-Tenericutes-6]|jgi:phospholipase/carboxylesterase|nr:MAG: carboxylesterase [Tenericutes bacterium HGW-Tenericutes-6]